MILITVYSIGCCRKKLMQNNLALTQRKKLERRAMPFGLQTALDKSGRVME